MSQDTGKNFFHVEADYSVLSLLSSKIRVLIIGAGRAGLIKAKSFAAKGCSVTILSLEFAEEFEELSAQYNVSLIKGSHYLEHIDNCHIVVIAVKDSNIINEIKRYCESKSKLYLACHDFKEGNFVVPTQGSSKNIYCSINTKEGSPVTSLYLMQRAKLYLSEYDDLVEYITNLRRKLKGREELKEIMNFVSNEDFNFFFKKGYADTIVKMFYLNIILE